MAWIQGGSWNIQPAWGNDMDFCATQAQERDIEHRAVMVAALLLREDAHISKMSPDVKSVRSVVERALGTEIGRWLEGRSPDGEQVLFVIDTLKVRAGSDAAFAASLAKIASESDTMGALRALGNNCRAAHQLDAALIVSSCLGLLARARDDLAAEASSVRDMSGLYEEMGSYDDALGCHLRLLKIHSSSGDASQIATALTDVGRFHGRRGRTDEAVGCMENAADLLIGMGDVKAAVRSLLAIAALFRSLGRRKEALLVIRRCRLLQIEYDHDPATSSRIRQELASMYEEEGHLEMAASLHELSRRALRSVGDRQGEAVTLRQMARVRLLQNRPGDAAACYLGSLNLAAEGADRGGSTSVVAPEDAAAAEAALRLVVYAEPSHSDRTSDTVQAMSTLALRLFWPGLGTADALG